MSTERRDIVAKFGGTSLANAERYKLVANIINLDYRRRVIVVSAPGVDKDSSDPVDHTKITEQLRQKSFTVVERRFLTIARGLGVCIDDDLEEIRQGLLVEREETLSRQWVESRGEWLSARIFARLLEAEFVDAAEIMKFDSGGTFNEERSYKLIAQILQGSQKFVVPGYYGQDEQGNIRTFPRGGSDITGSYLAAALRAEIYENWTDVNGVCTADPTIVPQARVIPFLYYEEMLELASLGAKVLHPLAVPPAWNRNVPINILNTFNPDHRGTWIANNFPLEKKAFPE